MIARTSLLVAVLAACSIAAAQDKSPVEKADQPDAVVKLWRQHWTLAADGTIVFHETKQVQINTDRANGDFADPRITYDADTQTVDVLAARTRLPGGKVIDVPEYGRTEVAPFATSGWPIFATIRQKVFVMSGIERGAVVELEYKLTTKAAAKAPLAADVRLNDRYPIAVHEIRIDVPRGVWLTPHLTGITEQVGNYNFEQRGDGSSTHTLVVPELPVLRDEPQSPPWQERGARLSFSTAGKADAWLSERLHALYDLSEPTDPVRSLASEWSRDKTGREDALRAIQEKFAATFNFVEVDPAQRRARTRDAEAILKSNYGTSSDAAVALLALARAANIPVQPATVLTDGVWVEKTPMEALVATDAVALLAEPMQFWHAQHGRMSRGKRWNACTIATAPGEGGDVTRNNWLAWTRADDSRALLTAELSLGDDASVTGKCTVRLTGWFVAADELRSKDAQNGRIGEIIRRALPAIEVQSVTIKSLSADQFEAEAQVRTSKPIDLVGDLRRLQLGGDGLAGPEIGLPASQSRRETPVRLAAAFEEHFDLTLSWPKGWKLEAYPSDVFAAAGEWGSVVNDAKLTDTSLKLSRDARIISRDVPPTLWLAAREAINELRTDRFRTLLLRKEAAK